MCLWCLLNYSLKLSMLRNVENSYDPPDVILLMWMPARSDPEARLGGRHHGPIWHLVVPGGWPHYDEQICGTEMERTRSRLVCVL